LLGSDTKIMHYQGWWYDRIVNFLGMLRDTVRFVGVYLYNNIEI